MDETPKKVSRTKATIRAFCIGAGFGIGGIITDVPLKTELIYVAGIGFGYLIAEAIIRLKFKPKKIQD